MTSWYSECVCLGLAGHVAHRNRRKLASTALFAESGFRTTAIITCLLAVVIHRGVLAQTFTLVVVQLHNSGMYKMARKQIVVIIIAMYVFWLYH